MVQLQIRGVTNSDIDCVAAIEAECFPKAEAAPREALAARINAYPECFLVAVAEGQLIGFVNGCATDSPVIYDELYSCIDQHRPNGKNLAIFGLDVVPDCRRHGVAAQLLQAFITLAKKNGRQGVILTCKRRLVHYYETFDFVNQGISQSTHGGAEWFDMTLVLR